MKNTLIAILIFVGIVTGLYYIGDIVTPWLANDTTVLGLAQGPIIICVLLKSLLGLAYLFLGVFALGVLGMFTILPMLEIKDYLDKRDKKREYKTKRGVNG